MPNEYLLCRPGRPLKRWRLEPTANSDPGYLGDVLAALDRRLKVHGLTFYVTYDLDRLPSYGADVVAIVTHDEEARVPRYSHRVAATFKTYGTGPTLIARPFREPPALTLLASLVWSRSLLRGAAGRASRAFYGVVAALRGRRLPPLEPIPLGWYRRPDLPARPAVERPVGISFMGSVGAQAGRKGLVARLPTPKSRARRELLRRLAVLDSGITRDVATTQDFLASKSARAGDYWRRLAASQVCLAPRGNAAESYRVFEAARAGCVVVCERLPRHWFYRGAPFVELTGWRDLDTVLTRLISDERELAARQRRTLDWWYDRCDPEAVAQFMADVLERAISCGRAGKELVVH
jgi:hypothetical protein